MTRTAGNWRDLIESFSRTSGAWGWMKVTYGDNLATNGTFDTDSDWTKIFATISGGKGTIDTTSSPGDIGYLTQTMAVTSGSVYEVSFDLDSLSVTAGAGSALFRYTVGGYTSGYFSAGSQTEVIVTSSTADFQFQAFGNNGTTAVQAVVDNLVIRKVTFDQADGTIKLFKVPNHVPRITYDGDGNQQGFLLEPQRTNLITYSNLSTTGWTETSLTSAYDVTGPDNIANSAKTYTATNTASLRSRFTTTQSVSTAYTVSAIVKAGTAAYFYIRNIALGAGSHLDDGVWWDTSDFSVTATGANVTYTGSIALGDGWYRIWMAGTTAGTIPSNYLDVGISNTNQTVDSVIGETGIIYHAQLEAGTSPTSIIKTSGGTVTRSEDQAYDLIANFGYNNNNGRAHGTWYFEFYCWEGWTGRTLNISSTQGGGDRVMDAYVRPEVDRVDVYATHTIGDLYNQTPLYTDGTLNKMAVVTRENNSKACINGGTVDVDTATTTPAVPAYVNFGRYAATGPTILKTVKYYPRSLSSAQLQEITS